MMTREQFRERVHDVTTAAWVAGALGAAFASGLADALREPRTIWFGSMKNTQRTVAVVLAPGWIIP